MKPARYTILFFTSLLLAAVTLLTPWAQAVFQVGEPASLGSEVVLTDERLTLPVYFRDGLVWVDGCPRGSVIGQNLGLDRWISAGRVLFVVQLGLWLAFLFAASLRRGYRGVALWSVGWVLLFWIFYLASNPTVECQYAQLPAPLLLTGQWYPGLNSLLAAMVNLLVGVWMVGSISRLPRGEKTG